MQLTVADNYLTMIDLLAELVKRNLAQPVTKLTRAKVNEHTFLLVSAALEQEDEASVDRELTAGLLGSREFRKIA